MDEHPPTVAPIEDDILSEILGESLAEPPEPAPSSQAKALDPGPAKQGDAATESVGAKAKDASSGIDATPASRLLAASSEGIVGRCDGASEVVATDANSVELVGEPNGRSQTENQDRVQTPQREAQSQNRANGAASPPATAAAQAAQNKIKGALFGAALGDALGLQTDGLRPSDIAERYPRGLKFPANVRNQGNPANDWSGLSDQMLLALRTLREWQDRLTSEPEHALAQKLAHWVRYGMADLGDTAGPTTDRLTREATKDPNFLLQPRTIAKKLQLQYFSPPSMGDLGLYSNPGALLRAIPAAFAAENPLHWSRLLTQVTHAAPRDELAARCAVRFVWAAASLGQQPLTAEVVVRQLDQLSAEAQSLGLEEDFEKAALPLFIDSHGLDFLSAAPAISPGMRIGADLSGITVYRVLACGLWILRAFIRGEPRTPEFVKDHLVRCAMMGGAACANAGLVGALLGAAVGYTGLPVDWLKALPFHDALASETDLFLKAIGQPAKSSREMGSGGQEPPNNSVVPATPHKSNGTK